MGMVQLGFNEKGGLVETKPVFTKQTRMERLHSLYVIHIYTRLHRGINLLRWKLFRLFFMK